MRLRRAGKHGIIYKNKAYSLELRRQNKFIMIEEWIQNIGELVRHSRWLAPLIALVAGVLTSLMPCSLSSVPLMISCVSAGVSGKKGNGEEEDGSHHHEHEHEHDNARRGRERHAADMCCCGHDHGAEPEQEDVIVCSCCGESGEMPHTQVKTAFGYSLVFCLGMSITFTALGLAASAIGHLLHSLETFWYIFIGALMIVMALQTLGAINIMPNLGKLAHSKYSGFAGAFLSGLMGGLFSSHCAAPSQVMLLAIAAESDSFLMGPLLLLLYAAGHSVLLILTGTFVGFFRRLSASKRFSRFVRAAEIAIGVFMLLFAAYMFWLAFVGD